MYRVLVLHHVVHRICGEGTSIELGEEFLEAYVRFVVGDNDPGYYLPIECPKHHARFGERRQLLRNLLGLGWRGIYDDEAHLQPELVRMQHR